jgi:hypothetical protein
MKNNESYIYWAIAAFVLLIYTIFKNTLSMFVDMEPMSPLETWIMLGICTILFLVSGIHWFVNNYSISFFIDLRLVKKNQEPPVEEYKN